MRELVRRAAWLEGVPRGVVDAGGGGGWADLLLGRPKLVVLGGRGGEWLVVEWMGVCVYGVFCCLNRHGTGVYTALDSELHLCSTRA
jgi:hypothetical protein